MELSYKIQFKDLEMNIQSTIFHLVGVDDRGTNLVENPDEVVIGEISISDLRKKLIRRNDDE